MKKLFVCALAVAMVFAFTAPTMAADWAFYGSARFETYSVDTDKEYTAGTTAYTNATGGAYSDTDTQWGVPLGARWGATVTAGDVGGKIEYNRDNGLRKIYGTWNFGAGSLLIGQDFTPIDNLYSNQQVDDGNGLLSQGMAYSGRLQQIKLTFGGFQVAFATPSTVMPATAVSAAGAITASVTGDVDTTLPRVEMAYTYATDMFSVKPYFGWNSVDFNKTLDSMESVTSMVYGIGGKVNFGPAYIAANVYGATNGGNYGLASQTALDVAYWDGTTLRDSSTIGYAALVGFKMSDMVTFEAGYGNSDSEMDFGTANKLEDDGNSYYINASITLAPGVIVVPEFGKIDNAEAKQGTTTIKQGSATYFGASWYINF